MPVAMKKEQRAAEYLRPQERKSDVLANLAVVGE